MSNSNSSKQVLLSVIIIAVLIIAVVGVAFAFFNYTRTGSANVIKVGRISFVSNNEETISLNNLFPIDPEETGIMNDSTKVGTYSIDITGDTDYSGGIEYLVSATDANIYTSTGKIVPISLDFTVEDLGTESSNYFSARENTNASIYKKIVGDTLVGDQMLLVGYIVPNTTIGQADGVDGSITIKAYLDENNILISDTYDGTESDDMGTPNSMAEGKTVFTTTEWNSLQANGVSFKIKVEANEGIWVTGSLEEIMKVQNINTTTNQPIRDDQQSTYVTGANEIDFGEVSSDTNGKGVYMRAGTQNDTYPILYYRGEVEDNNVVFNNKCWKAVRTTDTGGVKLIYNGELSTNKKELTSEDYGTPVTNTGSFTYDSTDNTWNATVTSSSNVEITFNVPVAGNYRMIIKGTYGSGSLLVLKDEGVATGTGGPQDQTMVFSYDYGALTTSNKIGVRSSGTSGHPYVLKVKVEYEDSTLGTGCNNMGTTTGITVENTNLFKFNTSSNSPAYNGYMYGDVYTSSSGVVSGAYYDSTFIWDGTNYKLTDSATTTKSNDRHYSCGDTTKTATCASLRYYYYGNDYITLTGGDGVEEALVKMQTNTNDSIAKDKIETWYGNQMNTVTNKLEDTIWCNDRSFGDNNNNGWIANGGDLSTWLHYGASERSDSAQNTSTVKNQPSLACANKNDRFTWKNSRGNGALDYPVGMLTEDEMVLAGGVAGKGSYSYLSSGSYYWSLSPNYLVNSSPRGFNWGNSGINGDYVNSPYGLRPAVSLKHGTPVVSGTGSVDDPYVIG